MENNLIGRNIFYLRKIKGITQQELASKINYSDKVISKWERGECLPDINALTSMASYFDVDIDFFIKEEKENNAGNELLIKESKNHNFHKPLIFLHIFFILLTISFLAKAHAIVDALPYGPEWSYRSAILISMAITIISITDIFLLHLKVSRLVNVILFFIICVIATCVLITSYISYGSIVDEAITKTIYYQIFSCIAVFVVGYFIEHTSKSKTEDTIAKQEEKNDKKVFSEKKSDSLSKKQNEKTNNTLHLSMIITSIFVIIFLALPFYNITVTFYNSSSNNNNNNNNEWESMFYDAMQEEFGNDVIMYDSEFNPIINDNNNNINIETEKPVTTKISFYQGLKNNVMYIMVLIVLIIIVLWDIVNFLYKKQAPRELLDKKTSGAIMLVSSVVFFILFFISQIVLLKGREVTELGNMIMVMTLEFMWGFFVCLTTMVSWTIIRISLALKLINRNAN